MAHVKVTLYQSIKVAGKWTFRKAPLQRLRMLSEGGYYVRFENRMEAAGRDPAVAIAALRRKQAELAFLALGGEIKQEEGEAADSKRVRLVDAVKEYIADCRDRQGKSGYGIAPRTVKAYSYRLSFLTRFRPGAYLDEIDTGLMRAFRRFLREQPKLGDRSCYNIMQAVSTFLAKNNNMAARPILAEMSFPPTPVIPYSDDELTGFFAACDQEEKLIFKFFLHSMARESEVAFTEVRDLLFDRNVLHISPKPDKGFRLKGKRSGQAKNGRKVPLPSAFMATLRDFCKGKPVARHFAGDGGGRCTAREGLTIKDRLRVLQPNDPDSYYESRELVPTDMLDDLGRAKIVITNYHAFKLRERMEISAGGRALLEGRHGAPVDTLETEGQMIQRVMPDLMGFKNILVLNDEAHHCYREKPGEADEQDYGSDEKQEVEKNKEAARLWMSGLEAVQRKIGLTRVFDLSATPFFLRGSGYAEGTLFPWTMSDFSLMDAIECGIVKLPRVPVADNIPGADVPIFRNLWEHIRRKMPKKGRGKAGKLDPLDLPTQLYTALDALYGHYKLTFGEWEKASIRVPPCFIIVCNNTSTSKLVYDYISGFERTNDDGTTQLENGRLDLFRNFDEHGNPYPFPRTLLIDSEELESGEALDPKFRDIASDEIERFRRDILERTGDRQQADNITDQDLLREVMNTVGKEGKLGGQIRCVVSVSMLTEGWDANTVTHVLGIRAFGTQLLCEQVIGRALRRQSYDLNEENLFNVEYADVLGIPFDFTAKPVVAPPQPPRQTIQVKAVRPERDHLEIRFPRVLGYRVDLPNERLKATFTKESVLNLTPELTGPSQTRNSGIVGEGVDLTVAHLEDTRPSTVLYRLTSHLLTTKWRDRGKGINVHLFGQLKRITKEWLDNYLKYSGGTYPAQILYRDLADKACERITAAITKEAAGRAPIKVLLDPYNPTGSTSHVNFTTSRTERWETDSRRCHINWVICDSGWEAEFCRIVESHPRVRAYVKNHNLGLDVPYRSGSESRMYRPDFILKVEDGHGEDNLLHLVVEIKGYRREDAKDKKLAMETYWVPGVNDSGQYGRWAFAEFTEVFEMENDLSARIELEVNRIINSATAAAEVPA